MILALDANVLIPWLVASAPGHVVVDRLIKATLERGGGRIGIVPQICWEFLHVVTDARRFERPLSMEDASAVMRTVWNAPETERLAPTVDVLPRVLELMDRHRLGRKRILDTVFAATLEAAGVRRLATFNGRDFAWFGFLDVVEPSAALGESGE